MNLIYQTNSYSCGICSLAMILDSSVEQLISIIGHDGSEIRFEGEPGLNSLRAFHPEELKDACLDFGLCLSEFVINPALNPISNPSRQINIFTNEQLLARFERYFRGRRGLIWGDTGKGHDHMVAIEYPLVYDPSVGVYHIDAIGRYLPSLKYGFVLVPFP